MVANQIGVKGAVSNLYKRVCMDTTDNTLDVKGKWEIEATTIISDDEWEESWMLWHKCLSRPSWREFAGS